MGSSKLRHEEATSHLGGVSYRLEPQEATSHLKGASYRVSLRRQPPTWEPPPTYPIIVDPARRQHLSHFDFLAREYELHDEVSELFGAPGFTVECCQIDWLHSTDLGVAADFVGGLFAYLVDTKLVGRTSKERCSELFRDIQEFYKDKNCEDRIPHLSPLMLRKKPTGWPKLRAKAGQTRALVPFSEAIAGKYLAGDGNDWEATLRAASVQLNSCYACLSEEGWNGEQFHLRAMKFALLFLALHRAPGQKYFKPKPKLHLFLEQSRQKLCPALVWTYRDESFGHTLSLYARRRGGKFSMSSTSRQMLQKFAAANKRPPLLT